MSCVDVFDRVSPFMLCENEINLGELGACKRRPECCGLSISEGNEVLMGFLKECRWNYIVFVHAK